MSDWLTDAIRDLTAEGVVVDHRTFDLAAIRDACNAHNIRARARLMEIADQLAVSCGEEPVSGGSHSDLDIVLRQAARDVAALVAAGADPADLAGTEDDGTIFGLTAAEWDAATAATRQGACADCRGQREVEDISPDTGDWVRVACPRCGGTGWEPDAGEDDEAS